MGIFYHFLSTLNGGAKGSPYYPRIHPWEYTTWLLRTEQELLHMEQTAIVQHSFFVDTSKCTLHREIWILIGSIVNQYNQDESNGTSGETVSFWKSLWNNWKERVPRFIRKHYATLWTMAFYKFLASLFCSETTFLKLTQHPYYRVKCAAFVDSSPLSVASSAFVVTVWSNALYYLADWTICQLSFGLAKRMKLVEADTESNYFDKETSWKSVYRQSLRLWYSSLGSAMGSVIWPGVGTLAGIGLGEKWADAQDLSPPVPLLKAFPRYFGSRKQRHGPLEKILKSTEMLCGCCQTNYFSSDPNHPNVPISSQRCNHTICKSCVDLIQAAELQRSGASDVVSSEQQAACPICETPDAFSPQDLVINQSLCQVIALLEQKATGTEPAIEIDIDNMKKLQQVPLERVRSIQTDDALDDESDFSDDSDSQFEDALSV